MYRTRRASISASSPCGLCRGNRWLSKHGPVVLQSPEFASSFTFDSFGLALSAVILTGTFFTCLTSAHYLPEQCSDHAEYSR